MEKKLLTEEQRLKRNAKSFEYWKKRYYSDPEWRVKFIAHVRRWQDLHSEEYHAYMRQNAARWREKNLEYAKECGKLYGKRRRAIKNGNLELVDELNRSLEKLREEHKKSQVDKSSNP